MSYNEEPRITVLTFQVFGKVKMTEFDYLYPLRTPFKIFKISGLWQDEKASTLYKFYGLFHIVIGIGSFTLCQLIYFIKAKSVLEASDVLSILFTYIGVMIKAITFVVKMQSIFEEIGDYKKLIASFEAMDKLPLVYLKARLSQANIIFRLLWGSCLVTTIFGGIYPFVAFFVYSKPPYRIAYKMWAPFEIENSVPGFLSVATLELLNSNFYCGVVSSVVVLPVFFFNAAAGLIEELSVRLSNIENEALTEDDATKRLIECIEIHINIKSFIGKAERIFSPMMFAEASCSLVIFCTTSFLLSKVGLELFIGNNLKIKYFYLFRFLHSLKPQSLFD